MLRHLIHLSAAHLFFLAGMALSPVPAADLAVVGTGDGFDMLKALSVAFNEKSEETSVLVPPSIGSGGGIAAVGSGKASLARVARKLSDAEIGRGLIYTPLAKLPSAFFVHPSAGITGLTSAQLADLYAGKVSNWKDVGGADMRVRVVRREDVDSTLVVLREQMPGWKDLVITERSKMATSTQEAIETVRLVEGAIGFGPFTKELEQGTTVLAIDGQHPTSPTYPSAAILAFVHMADTITPGARAFMAFCMGPEGKDIIKAYRGVPVE